jgi:hypothetical protein
VGWSEKFFERVRKVDPHRTVWDSSDVKLGLGHAWIAQVSSQLTMRKNMIKVPTPHEQRVDFAVYTLDFTRFMLCVIFPT